MSEPLQPVAVAEFSEEAANKLAAIIVGRIAQALAGALGLTLAPVPKPESGASWNSSSASTLGGP